MDLTLGGALLTGTGIGLLALFPGLHFAMLLLVFGPGLIASFGLTNGLLSMAWAVAIARCMHTLAVVYHPVAADSLAAADPAQRLRARGQGHWATQIMGENLMLGVVLAAALVGFFVFLSQLTQADLIRSMLRGSSWLLWPALVGWVGFMLYSAKRPFSTLLVFLAAGLLGLIALQHPSVRGSTQAMTPLLTGLFGVPVLLLTLFERGGKSGRLDPLPVRDASEEVKLFGLVAGLFSLALPGLGTSSLVSIGQDLVEDDAEYLTMASLAESLGGHLALLLGMLSIASRSSDAAVIQTLVLKQHGEFVTGPSFPYVLCGLLIGATYLGLKLVPLIGIPYRVLLFLVPSKLQALLVMGGMIWVVWSHTSLWGIMITLSGTLIHLGARQLGTPNQAFFACLVVPMVYSMLGFTWLG